MISKNSKPFWNKTTIAIFSSVLTSVTLIIVAIITGLFSKYSSPTAVKQPVTTLTIDNSPLILSQKNISQTNKNKGNVSNEFVSGNKVTTVNKLTTPKSIDSTTSNHVIGKNINLGTNNGIIGDNAIINTPIQPHPENYQIDEFVRMYPNKTIPIRFYVRSDSRMSHTFAGEIITLLTQRGYKDVGLMLDLSNSLKTDRKAITKMDNDSSRVNYFVQVEDN